MAAAVKESGIGTSVFAGSVGVLAALLLVKRDVDCVLAVLKMDESSDIVPP